MLRLSVTKSTAVDSGFDKTLPSPQAACTVRPTSTAGAFVFYFGVRYVSRLCQLKIIKMSSKIPRQLKMSVFLQ